MEITPSDPALSEQIDHMAWLRTPAQQRRVLILSVIAMLVVSVVMGVTLPGAPHLPSPWDRVSAVIGWVYFWAWSVSFYPQVYLNYVRKSVVGLSFDYSVYNILGFACYTVFNCLFRWSDTIQAEYGACSCRVTVVFSSLCKAAVVLMPAVPVACPSSTARRTHQQD